MKKVAIFQTDLSIGGIEKSLVNLLNKIDYKEYEIDLYLFSKDKEVYKNDIPESVNIIYLEPLKEIIKFLPFRLVKLFYKTKINKEYDIAIDYNSYSPDTALNAIKVVSKKKIIWIHNDVEIKLKEEYKYRILHFFFKAKYKYFNTFVAVSKGALDSFKKIHKLNNKEYKVIPNIINTDEIKLKMKEETTLRPNKDTINLVTVGRLVHQKGFDILLDKYKEVIAKNQFYHLYIIGDGIKKEELKTQIRDHNLSKYVTILGYKKNPFNIMNLMDAFVLTSRYEGQGMVFKEAEAIGLDVILPVHLSKYVTGIKPTNDVVSSILKLEKHKHKFNDLKEYNDNIINEFKKL